MPTTFVQGLSLACHPATPSSAITQVRASLRRTPRGLLAVTYTLEGDLERVRIPAPCPPRSADGLWRSTCCEMFVARPGLPAYHEFNFSPSGEWAAYAFDSYRSGAALASEALNPQVTVRGTGERMELDAVIRLDLLSPAHGGAPLVLGLSAVVEDEAGALSYWALRHPPGKPDFHHADAFALELE